MKYCYSIMFLFSILYALPTVTIFTENYPPLNYIENSETKGPAVEIVEEIAKRTKTSHKIMVLPWTRGFRITRQKKNSCIFSTVRTTARDSLFIWIGPIAKKKWGFFGLKNNHFKINSFEDAKKFKVASQYGGFSQSFLENRNFENLSLSIEPKVSFRKLKNKEVDLWHIEVSTPWIFAEHDKVAFDDLELVLTSTERELYIAFNKNTDPKIVKAWQQAYDDLVKDNFIYEVFEKYGLKESSPVSKRENE